MDIFSSFSSQILNGAGTLSLFPALFSFSLLAPTILRLASGLALASIAIGNLKLKTGTSLSAGLIQILASLSILAGFLTQAGAIIGAIIVIARIFSNIGNYSRPEYFISYHLLILAILTSIIISGAGAFGLDLPL